MYVHDHVPVDVENSLAHINLHRWKVNNKKLQIFSKIFWDKIVLIMQYVLKIKN